MAKRTKEVKVSEQLAEALNDYWFSPAVFANVMVNNQPLYTQDRLMELMTWVIKYQAERFKNEWEHEITSEGLMLASHLSEVIEAHGK